MALPGPAAWPPTAAAGPRPVRTPGRGGLNAHPVRCDDHWALRPSRSVLTSGNAFLKRTLRTSTTARKQPIARIGAASLLPPPHTALPHDRGRHAMGSTPLRRSAKGRTKVIGTTAAAALVGATAFLFTGTASDASAEGTNGSAAAAARGDSGATAAFSPTDPSSRYGAPSLLPAQGLLDPAARTGGREFILAFVTSAGSCTPLWGGTHGLESKGVVSRIAALRAEGGDVRISFGGASARSRPSTAPRCPLSRGRTTGSSTPTTSPGSTSTSGATSSPTWQPTPAATGPSPGCRRTTRPWTSPSPCRSRPKG